METPLSKTDHVAYKNSPILDILISVSHSQFIEHTGKNLGIILGLYSGTVDIVSLGCCLTASVSRVQSWALVFCPVCWPKPNRVCISCVTLFCPQIHSSGFTMTLDKVVTETEWMNSRRIQSFLTTLLYLYFLLFLHMHRLSVSGLEPPKVLTQLSQPSVAARTNLKTCVLTVYVTFSTCTYIGVLMRYSFEPKTLSFPKHLKNFFKAHLGQQLLHFLELACVVRNVAESWLSRVVSPSLAPQCKNQI